MGLIENRLNELGIILPTPPKAAANYIPFKISDKFIFVAGQIPIKSGSLITGKVGDTITIEKAKEAARICGVSIISQLKEAAQDNLDKINSIIKISGFVNCTNDFTEHPEVINGASEIMVDVFGEVGRHARFAVGSNSLPKGVCVEIDAIAQLK